MKLVLLIIASLAATPAFAGLINRGIPALDEFGLVTLALIVGVVGARAVQRYKSRGKKDA